MCFMHTQYLVLPGNMHKSTVSSVMLCTPHCNDTSLKGSTPLLHLCIVPAHTWLDALDAYAQTVDCDVCHNKTFNTGCGLCRSESAAAAQQLQAAQSEAANVALSRAQLQHQLAEVETQRQQSQAELRQAEQNVQQLQVHIRGLCREIWL